MSCCGAGHARTHAALQWTTTHHPSASRLSVSQQVTTGEIGVMEIIDIFNELILTILLIHPVPRIESACITLFVIKRFKHNIDLKRHQLILQCRNFNKFICILFYFTMIDPQQNAGHPRTARSPLSTRYSNSKRRSSLPQSSTYRCVQSEDDQRFNFIYIFVFELNRVIAKRIQANPAYLSQFATVSLIFRPRPRRPVSCTRARTCRRITSAARTGTSTSRTTSHPSTRPPH